MSLAVLMNTSPGVPLPPLPPRPSFRRSSCSGGGSSSYSPMARLYTARAASLHRTQAIHFHEQPLLFVAVRVITPTLQFRSVSTSAVVVGSIAQACRALHSCTWNKRNSISRNFFCLAGMQLNLSSPGSICGAVKMLCLNTKQITWTTKPIMNYSISGDDICALRTSCLNGDVNRIYKHADGLELF